MLKPSLIIVSAICFEQSQVKHKHLQTGIYESQIIVVTDIRGPRMGPCVVTPLTSLQGVEAPSSMASMSTRCRMMNDRVGWVNRWRIR